MQIQYYYHLLVFWSLLTPGGNIWLFSDIRSGQVVLSVFCCCKQAAIAGNKLDEKSERELKQQNRGPQKWKQLFEKC